MRDTIAQTRFERVSKKSNDSLLARGNTLQSDEDRMKFDELIDLWGGVKKLEKRNRSRTHKLKRLYKVGLSARVESSEDEESLGEYASKHGGIDAIDADDDITLVSVQDDVDNEIFDVDTLTDDECKVKGDVIEEPSVPVSATSASIKVSAATTTATIPTPRKGIVITELGTPTITRSSQQPS
ncbi:hypothetical protein Tco_1287335 [Tanacetum coccineum]